MNSKYLKLISLLKSSDESMSSSFIGHKLNVSNRTIKNHVNEINNEYPNLIISTSKGYLLNKELFSNIEIENEEIPQSQDERIRFIINYLLSLEKDQSLDIDELADTIYVSNVTIRRDLQIISEVCQKYRIRLTISNDYISLQGKEKDKRALMNHLYTSEFEQNEISFEKLENLFPDYDISLIKTITINKCKEFNYLINGYTINNIVLDILIQMNRIQNSFSSEQAIETVQFNVHELDLARAITKEFENIYHISYSDEEIQSFTITLFTHLLRIDFQKITTEDLIHIVGKDVFDLANEIIEETNDYFLKNQNEEFFTRFTLHLKNLLLRAKTNYINQNLLTDTIRNSCPLLFECAVNISNTIYQKTGYQINDDEIAYIAIHIGSLLETNTSFKLSCALVMPKYYNLTEEIQRKIENRIGSDATLKVIAGEDFNQYNSLDLIITTETHLPVSKDKCFIFTGIVNDKVLDMISAKVTEIKKRKNMEFVINQLVTITSSKFFYKNPEFTNKDNLIEMMAGDLLDSGIVNYNYLDDVMYREKISSTAFNQIAVPHTLTMNSNQTMISIALFDKPVLWSGKKVRAVFMFAIHPSDKKLFHYIFDNLVSLLINEENVALLASCNDYNQFINTIPYVQDE